MGLTPLNNQSFKAVQLLATIFLPHWFHGIISVEGGHQMKAKRTYKDSLFRDIFNNKRRLQRIYEALTGTHISLSDITITTLRGTFFEDIKNDISFMAGNQHIILMEHQSTLSENMPLRML